MRLNTNIRKTNSFFSYLEIQRRLIQIKLFYSIWENVLKIFKSSSWKNVFLKCVYHWYNLELQWIFLFHGITGRHYFLYKFIVTHRFGTTTMLLNLKVPNNIYLSIAFFTLFRLWIFHIFLYKWIFSNLNAQEAP